MAAEQYSATRAVSADKGSDHLVQTTLRMGVLALRKGRTTRFDVEDEKIKL